jgi:hypothetical protein
MKKIAIRLGLLVAIMVIGVLVFIRYRSQQAPPLVQLIPQEAEAFAFVDTRNLVKNAFTYGGGALQDLEVPPLLQGLFAAAAQPKEPGINLFSEWVWFAFPQGHAAISVRLANPENWEKFLTKKENEAFLQPIERFASDLSLCRIQHVNALLAWRGKQLVLVYNDPNSDPVSYAEAKAALQPTAYHTTPPLVFKAMQPDLYFQSKEESVAIKLLPGKLRFDWKSPAHHPDNAFFQSVSLANENRTAHDTSFLALKPGTALLQLPFIQKELHPFMQSALLQMEELKLFESQALKGLPLYFQFTSFPAADAEDNTVRVQPQTSAFTLPAYLKAKPDSLKGIQIVINSKLEGSDLGLFQQIEGFERLVLVGAEKAKNERSVSGTLYLKEKERLPLRETALILLQSNVFKFPGLDTNTKSSTGTHIN